MLQKEYRLKCLIVNNDTSLSTETLRFLSIHLKVYPILHTCLVQLRNLLLSFESIQPLFYIWTAWKKLMRFFSTIKEKSRMKFLIKLYSISQCEKVYLLLYDLLEINVPSLEGLKNDLT